jgi:Icc-related predicted phosphoesterase
MPFLKFGGKKEEEKSIRILFATDLHGATHVFLKFISAAKLYKADIAVLGGDITGKMIIPIIKQSDGTYTANFMDKTYTLRTLEELRELESNICYVGFYPYHLDEREMEELKGNPEKSYQIFEHLMCKRVEEWVKLADERLKDTNIRCFITGGNDDPLKVTQVIKKLQTEHVTNPEGEVVHINDHEMVSCGYGNITPWKCPRDISEDELADKIESMVSQVRDINNCIFNFHVPPINSTLDTCVKLDTSVTPPKPIIGENISAGSIAVRKAIEKYQPMLGLHGHIHESRGAIKIGRTLCLNPGSEYSESILRAVIVNVAKNRIISYQFITG